MVIMKLKWFEEGILVYYRFIEPLPFSMWLDWGRRDFTHSFALHENRIINSQSTLTMFVSIIYDYSCPITKVQWRVVWYISLHISVTCHAYRNVFLSSYLHFTNRYAAPRYICYCIHNSKHFELFLCRNFGVFSISNLNILEKRPKVGKIHHLFYIRNSVEEDICVRKKS